MSPAHKRHPAHKRRLYAHRGAAAQEPENTMPSFERALGYGAHALEMDVHATSDGVVVVSHDADGLRMCGESRDIRETPHSEVRKWDAGWGFVSGAGQRPCAGRDYRIPTLAEVLENFPNTCINVDIKQKSPSMVAEVLRIIRQAGAESSVQLASFSQTTLLRLRLAGYRGLTAMGPWELGAALLTPNWCVRPWPWRGLAAQVPTHARVMRLATQKHIAKFHALGARVDFWTINDVEQARSLLDMGADGIMTDDPKSVIAAFDGAREPRKGYAVLPTPWLAREL